MTMTSTSTEEDGSHNADTADSSTTSGGRDCDVTTPVTTVSRAAAARSGSGSSHFSIAPASSAMEEEEEYPKTQQEELNEILEAFYELISDEQIRNYQQYIEEIERQSLSSKAVQAPEKAPDFEMLDQDGDMVRLSDTCKKGPVILVFYRGKWCPHCNAVIINLQGFLPEIQLKGASIIAISPMLPDGTAVFATKRSLQFPVLSDVGNTVARQFRLTFQVPTLFRPVLLSIGEDIPLGTGNDSWEVPLPATYIINQEGNIVWAFIDDDQHYRAEPADILAAIPTSNASKSNNDCDDINHDDNDSNDGTGTTLSRTRGSFKNPCNNAINQRTAKAPPRWRRMARPSPPPQQEESSSPSSREFLEQSLHLSDASGSSSMGSSSDTTSSTTTSKKSSLKTKVMQVFGRKKQQPMEFLGNYVCND